MKFRTIPSAPDYAATEDGRILSFSREKNGAALKPLDDGRAGYAKVNIRHKDGRWKSRYVHHLVAEAFLGPRPNGSDIDHVNGNKRDNRTENLRYCSRLENMTNPNNNGLVAWQKFSARKVLAWRDGETPHLFECAVEAARRLGVCLSGVSNVLSEKLVNKGYRNGRVRMSRIMTCGGYRFAWAS